MKHNANYATDMHGSDQTNKLMSLAQQTNYMHGRVLPEHKKKKKGWKD